MNRREAAEPGCCGTKATRVQQPQRRAVRLNLDQSPAPQRLRPRAERQTQQLFQGEFVLHTLRHTMLTRLGESGVDAFTIMKIAGHSSIVVSQRMFIRLPKR
jgi:integrase